MDAESSVFKFRCVTVFNAARCASERGMTENTVLPVEFSHYNFRTAKTRRHGQRTGGAFFIFHQNGGYLSFALSFSSERSLSTKRAMRVIASLSSSTE